MDVLVAGIALMIAGPLIALLAAAVRLTSRGPAFYRQARLGSGGEQFTILKLRSMVSGADRDGPLVTSRADSRVTVLGVLLRAAKLDELPQLINVLRGDMTLIGPRPEVPQFLACYNAEEREILSVRPGLTGPGQIFYTQVQQAAVLDGVNPEEHYANCELHAKLAVDLDYLRRRSLRLDLSILVRTVLLLTKLGKPIPAPERIEDDVSTIVMVAWPGPAAASHASARPVIQRPPGAESYPAPGTWSAAARLPRPSAQLVRSGYATATELDDQPTIIIELEDLLADLEPEPEPDDQPRGGFFPELFIVILVAAMIGSAVVLLLR